MKLSWLASLTLLFSMGFSALAHEPPQTDTEKQQYIDQHVEIFDVVSKYFNGYGEDPGEPGLQYAVKNRGPQTIGMLYLTFYFIDKEGLRFGEHSLDALHVGWGERELLKPNYTKRTEKNKFIPLGNLGEEWSGELEYEVTKIVFAEQQADGSWAVPKL
jgi:hypothetical protein